MAKTVEEVNSILSQYIDLDELQSGDEGVLYHFDPSGGATEEGVVAVAPEGYVPVGNGVANPVLQQRWITLTASMWPPEEPTASPAFGGTGGTWRLPPDRLPLFAAVFCGAALVVCIIFAIIVYRCFIMPKREKHFCSRKPSEEGHSSTQTPSGINAVNGCPSQTAVYAEGKGYNWGYTNRLVPAVPGQGGQWVYSSRGEMGGPQCTRCPGVCPVPRSTSNPGNSNFQIRSSSTNNQSSRRERPVSQPVQFEPCDLVSNGKDFYVKQIPMPEISEYSPQGPQYASSSILDEVNSNEGETTLKTRSLPAWVRSKPRPLSTEDDLNDLYAKVNFSKKRKNRMRNDEAAIIALSKSRSQYLHKDTDSLVDNEAVIVYNERTAL